MPRRRREGFDYFVDKYENTYEDDFDSYGPSDNQYYYDDYYGRQHDRFSRRNRYTGEIYSPRQINTSTISYNRPPQGTLEFSAVPNHGLDPNSRPLGDETMMISQVSNPYLKKIQNNLNEVSQEIDRKFVNVDDAIGALSNKVDSSISALSAKIDQMAEITNTRSLSIPPTTANTTQFNYQQTPKVQSTVVRQPQQPKRKKLSVGVIVGCTIGIIVAIGLIVVGILLIMGIISFG